MNSLYFISHPFMYLFLFVILFILISQCSFLFCVPFSKLPCVWMQFFFSIKNVIISVVVEVFFYFLHCPYFTYFLFLSFLFFLQFWPCISFVWTLMSEGFLKSLVILGCPFVLRAPPMLTGRPRVPGQGSAAARLPWSDGKPAFLFGVGGDSSRVCLSFFMGSFRSPECGLLAFWNPGRVGENPWEMFQKRNPQDSCFPEVMNSLFVAYLVFMYLLWILPRLSNNI